MYPNGYNMYQNRQVIPRRRPNNQNNRFVTGGFVVPFLLGGLTGGAVANNWRPNNPFNPIYPTGYMPYPTYYNNFYYPPYGPMFYR